MAPIKVGLMGYGSSTKYFHLPFILPNPDLDVVAFLQRAEAPEDKSNVEPGKHCTVDHPKAKHYRTAEDFFADDEIELVIVCTSSAMHFEFGKQALLAGKHVVIEKPFTVTTAEADKLIALSKEKNKTLTVYQNRRYDSDFRTLQHLMSLNPNPFGTITEFENHYDLDNPPWIAKWGAQTPEEAPGEGMLYGLGTHSIDQTLLLFGLPKSVTAFLRYLRPDGGEGAVDDSFTIVLQYEGNLIATVKTTIVSPGPRQMKFWVRGTHGSFTKDGEDVQMEHIFENNMKADDTGFGIEPARYHGTLYTRKELETRFQKDGETGVVFSGKIPSKPGSYMDYYRDLVATIRGEKELVVKPEESRNGIRIIELARESAEKGVTVPWSEGP
ncbi:hypothetical protein LTR37_018061 [Vermiconidia calcicola]|uniref:Uncharacterized protein n=1 Tax=Vermiconidia calcicola TaxID=1690605 RepID=A0ACC3MI92_9PEZI|nr:hypothetical protein LTR37_018061 [Vermiconidia calcicola]